VRLLQVGADGRFDTDVFSTRQDMDVGDTGVGIVLPTEAGMGSTDVAQQARKERAGRHVLGWPFNG